MAAIDDAELLGLLGQHDAARQQHVEGAGRAGHALQRPRQRPLGDQAAAHERGRELGAGMGFSHAMVCDLRFAASGAKFTTAFVRRGLIAEWALAWTLQRVAGPARALDVLMSGRVVLAEEAKELGIVNDVLPADKLVDHAIAYASDLIANCSPSSMAAIKRQVWHAGEQTIDESLDWSIKLMRASLTQADFKEGVSSFVEKRPPAFPPVTRGWATDIEP
jgi:1,4-dihydroxy-2-naphthoyl-CoA synthase